MRVSSVFVVLLMTALSWLPAPDLFWWPQNQSSDGNALGNWSGNSLTFVPVDSFAGANLRFEGNGVNGANCVFTADISVVSITSPADVFGGTFSDGGNTITVSGDFSMLGGNMECSGTLVSTGPAAVLTLPTDNVFLPSLTILGTATLQGTGQPELPVILGDDRVLTIGPGAIVNLSVDLVLRNNATFVQQPGTGGQINGPSSLMWQRSGLFPAASALTITAPVRIVQIDAESVTSMTLPGGWNFGGSLSLVTVNTLGDIPELTVHVQGPVLAAGDVTFIGQSAGAQINVVFATTGARLSSDGTIGNPSPNLGVTFEAGSESIHVVASRVDFSEPLATFSLSTGDLTSANFTVSNGIAVSSGGSSSAPIILALSGAGNGDGVIDLDLSNTSHTWAITKTGAASELVFATSTTARVSRIDNTSTTDTTVTGAEVALFMVADSVIQVSETGGLRIGVDLELAGLSQHVLRNESLSGSNLELAGTLYGSNGASTDVVVETGTVIISGTDTRQSGGVDFSRTLLAGNGAIVDYRNDASLVHVVASNGNNTQLRGTGSVASFSSNSSDLVTVQPGSSASADYGVLRIDTANLLGFSTTPVDVRLKISGNTGPGSDYDRLETNEISVNEGSTRLVLDLTNWNGGSAVVQGIVTYTSLNGNLLNLPLELIGIGNKSVELIHDPNNQRYDLNVTVTIPEPGVPPVPGVFVTPTLPISTRRSTIWTAVCPGTEAGLANLVAQLSGRSREDVRAFTWDSTTQQYVEFPAVPTGGFEPWHGWFIATMVPMSLDFTGIFDGMPHRVPLQAGWNLVGVGPVSGEPDATQFPLPNLELRTEFNATLTGTDRGAVIGPTVAHWTGTIYQDVAAFTSGRAYWVYNADPDLHQLVYAGGGLDPVINNVTSATPTAAATPTPPAPPPLGGEVSADDRGSCGGGSAFGFLVLVIALSGLRRQRVIRP